MKKFNCIIAFLFLFQLLNLALPANVQAAVVSDFFNPNVGGEVFATAVQSTGKILVGGSFTQISSTTRNRIGRLNPDGTLDSTFTVSLNNTVRALAVQSDDKILVGGDFTNFSSTERDKLIRLTSEGALDGSFSRIRIVGSVYAIAVQQDGKILIGGDFSQIVIGTSTLYDRINIARLNANGTMDSSFNPGAPGDVRALTVQQDGKILVGGYINTLAGVACNRIGRLNENGSLDPSFTASANNGVFAIAVHANGRILIGGKFSSVNGVTPRGGIARLYPNGSLDLTLAPTLGRNDVKTIVIQPNGKILFGGWFSEVNGLTRTMLARMNFDGSLDAGFAPSFGDGGQEVNTLTLQPDGKILAGGTFTFLEDAVTNRLARIYPDGSPNGSKDIFTAPTLSHMVSAIALHPNGGILIGGDFEEVGGVSHIGIARIRPNGRTDESFNAIVADPGKVNAIAVQSDGKILVGGSFTNMNYETRYNIGRLNPDGSLDGVFYSNVNGPVYAIAIQKDGKILIGGNFTQVGGTNRSYIARLNTDGTLDATFVTPEVGGVVRAIALHYFAPHYNELVLIGGDFTYVGTAERYHLARLGTIGALDTSFNPAVGNYESGKVHSLLVQPDGKILVAGDFISLTGVTIKRIGRLNANGSRDTSFIIGTNAGANDTIYTMALQADGKILVGGAFTQLHNVAMQRVGRLHNNGTLDTSFLPGETNGAVLALALQPDGKALAGGSFTTLNGSPVTYLERIATDESAYQKLNVDSGGTEIWWIIRGPMPNFHRVAFEFSRDGINYTHAGFATFIGSDNWFLGGDTQIPNQGNLFIRAKGYASSGAGNGSISITESVLNVFYPGNSVYLPLIIK